ncbi:hypothetical protein [Usitatibacter palustris]|uniref:FecR family protein n=1 Tax=Usitatibacter palustris TaxID=2732487 RepID=A0A6M4H2E0_9PROT|nr:hypothetical protein [Usitatibacter palustris]QJR13711.1 hypothetical protein DSM104440_00501 [Usitatibacter palustris]
MRTIQRVILLIAAFAASAALASEGIAFLTNVKGEVAVDANTRPAVLAELTRGQKIILGKDAHAAVMFIATGKEYVLRGPADYVVKDTEISASSGVPPVTRNTEWRASNKVLVQVAQTSAASVRMRSIPPPKVEPAARLIYPTAGNIATLQPTLKWASPDPQAEVSLSVVGVEKPVLNAKAQGNAYKVPAKLKPDAEYTWVVSTASGEVGSGKFHTLPSEAVQRIEKRRPSDKADFSDRLLFALLLQEMGATQEAREAWAKLAQERTDLPELGALAR